MSIKHTDSFTNRHVGPRASDLSNMLKTIGVDSLNQLIDEAVPPAIRSQNELQLPVALSEWDYLNHVRDLAKGNKVFRSFIGMGYYDTLVPPVILRNVLKNPGWYTPYTPYQAEIAQGRLEGLLNFQTMVCDLTGLPVANASLLDEATAAAEAMMMLHRLQSRKKKGADTFLVATDVFPQTLDVLQARAQPLGVDLVIQSPETMEFGTNVFGCLIQTPDSYGAIKDLSAFIDSAHKANVLVAVATDLMACVMTTPPGEMGADVVFGSAQRFGVPMGYGGPHAAFFACREDSVREAPGRIIGVSKDALGRTAYRMSLQTREQHIRREKAKSNICTAQALLANMAGFYAVWHGPEGLRDITGRIHSLAVSAMKAICSLGWSQDNPQFFDTLLFSGGPASTDKVRTAAEALKLNFHYFDDGRIGLSFGEACTPSDLNNAVTAFANAAGQDVPTVDDTITVPDWPNSLMRTSDFLAHSVFHDNRSETEMMRYLKRLEDKDIGLDTSMIPLGSCTMKLNAAAEMIPVTWSEFGDIHPFAPSNQTDGYARLIQDLESHLAEITGFHAVSLQPNSGAQGEFTGLMVIRARHHDKGETHRNVTLIPSSAHGTNPASAVMAGMKVVVVKCDDLGNIDIDDLKALCVKHAANLSSLMVTYPSTFGVFEDRIQEICQIVHDHGGLVYMDGANMNAQVGLTSPGLIGADVCHLNLHKTFAIPHGGGGPGMGPIGVTKELSAYLPGHSQVTTGGSNPIPAISAAPYGSASILLISYGYIRMLGKRGLVDSTRAAILNANYLKEKLTGHWDILFSNDNGRVAHEMIFDLRPLKKSSGITEEDVAKRLMDYGFHAPTVSWPVVGTMMIEPTESESKAELDRFVAALIQIRAEIAAVENGTADRLDNVLKNAPHPVHHVCDDNWDHTYTRKAAAYPLPWVRDRKVWPSVARIDNASGDRHLICSCPPLESYQEASTA